MHGVKLQEIWIYTKFKQMLIFFYLINSRIKFLESFILSSEADDNIVIFSKRGLGESPF